MFLTQHTVCTLYNNVFVFLGILLTGGEDPDQEMIDLRMNAVKHKIIILSGKGGTGSKL